MEQQIISLCYLLFLQIAFINTKSQLFMLQNNKIILSQNVDKHFDDIFYIISTTEPQFGNTWTKESDNYDFTNGIDGETE